MHAYIHTYIHIYIYTYIISSHIISPWNIPLWLVIFHIFLCVNCVVISQWCWLYESYIPLHPRFISLCWPTFISVNHLFLFYDRKEQKKMFRESKESKVAMEHPSLKRWFFHDFPMTMFIHRCFPWMSKSLLHHQNDTGGRFPRKSWTANPMSWATVKRRSSACAFGGSVSGMGIWGVVCECGMVM